jgi:hypothetical protein
VSTLHFLILVVMRLMETRQNTLGNVVLFNRRNNAIQLSMNSHPLDDSNGTVSPTNGLCPTCHRSLANEAAGHSPAFMDSEYFRLLSSNATTNEEAPAPSMDNHKEEIPASKGKTRSGSLPTSAFNQGYFERFFVVQSELGRGARGVVLKVTHVLDNIALGDYAVKRVYSKVFLY